MEIPSLDAGGSSPTFQSPERGCRLKGKRLIEDFYEVLEEIGRGSFGVVRRARHLASGGFYAVKVITKAKFEPGDLSGVFSEVEIITLLKHRYIIDLKEVFQTKDTLYLVMELLLGGALSVRLKAAARFPEALARRYARNVLLAVEYIHRVGIAHRDLKPANMLLASDADTSEVKIVDFGLAVLIGHDATLDTLCGTLAYMAPEILNGYPYGQAVDMWAVGVILYQMVSGVCPFAGNSRAAIGGHIARGLRNLQTDFPADVSPDCRDLVRRLLDPTPAHRITAPDSLNHPWIRSGPRDDGAWFPTPSLTTTPCRPTLLRGVVWAVVAAHRLVALPATPPFGGQASPPRSFCGTAMWCDGRWLSARPTAPPSPWGSEDSATSWR
eukprot:TRINITY_DN16045_c0_g1_i1.p1 TRINITY_DN16045_c0_g1~~TRINITY_DN16045_c0_g1_i1.p1  ORF type:complete len:402 (-),score=55.55 TRINITY_DN16045_c0_g1_i1:762-1910(-)